MKTKKDKQEYKEYRKKYQANWERKKYHTNPQYRESQLKARKERLQNMAPKLKELYKQKQKIYQRKRFDNMNEKEQQKFMQERKAYLKNRRDTNISQEFRDKYNSMGALQKRKFLEKLTRYKKILNEFKAELVTSVPSRVSAKQKKSRKKK